MINNNMIFKGWSKRLLGVIILIIVLYKVLFDRTVLTQLSEGSSFFDKKIIAEYSRYHDDIYFRGISNGSGFINVQLKGVVSQKFHIIGGGGDFLYATDGIKVRHNELPISGADALSFTMDGVFGIDKNAVYYMNNKLSVDRKNFRVKGELYGDDKKVYAGTDIEFVSEDQQGNNIYPDPTTLKMIICEDSMIDVRGNSPYYYIDKKWIYSYDNSMIGLGHALGTGFDYDSLYCYGSVLEDKDGLYAVIYGSGFFNTVIVRK